MDRWAIDIANNFGHFGVATWLYHRSNMATRSACTWTQVVVILAFTLYLDLGSTVNSAWTGFYGTLLPVLNCWLMFFLYPNGVAWPHVNRTVNQKERLMRVKFVNVYDGAWKDPSKYWVSMDKNNSILSMCPCPATARYHGAGEAWRHVQHGLWMGRFLRLCPADLRLGIRHQCQDVCLAAWQNLVKGARKTATWNHDMQVPKRV